MPNATVDEDVDLVPDREVSQGMYARPPAGRPEDALHGLSVAAHLVLLPSEGLHDAHRADGLLGHGGGLREPVLDLPREAAHDAAEVPRRERDRRHNQEDAQR